MGDLSVVADGGLRTAGQVYVDNDRAISVSGPVTIEPSGLYAEYPGANDVSASLTAESVAILGGACSPFVLPGEMDLTDSMSVSTTGDFILDGRTADPLCSGMMGGQSAVPLGGQTPPVLKVGCLPTGTASSDPSTASPSADELSDPAAPALTVEGDFVVLEVATVAMAPASCTAAAAAVSSSKIPTLFLGGNFDNQSKYPSTFDWDAGRLTFIGTAPQTFEVAGRNLGRTADGFDTGTDTNFSMTASLSAFGRGMASEIDRRALLPSRIRKNRL